MKEELGYESKRDWWLWFFHPDYVEHRKYPDFADYVAFFRFTCDKHGEQVSYQEGYRKRLICPECKKLK